MEGSELSRALAARRAREVDDDESFWLDFDQSAPSALRSGAHDKRLPVSFSACPNTLDRPRLRLYAINQTCDAESSDAKGNEHSFHGIR